MEYSLASFINKVICGDARTELAKLPSDSIDCVVTSPPYWSLRDYRVNGQIGLERTVQEYIARLCAVFDEINRVLKPTGMCWVNLGDTYAAGWSRVARRQSRLTGRVCSSDSRPARKSLCQVPSRFALQMADRGWILRNEIIWWKPNAMPTSAKDRFTVDFEKLFLFVKSPRYFFVQQFEPPRDSSRVIPRPPSRPNHRKRLYGDPLISAINPSSSEASRLRILAHGRNKRAVWAIPTRPFSGKHFAVFPPELVETPILAGSPKNGIVLDPFVGSGTTALVARRLGRRFIGIELNPTYVRLAVNRLSAPLPT